MWEKLWIPRIRGVVIKVAFAVQKMTESQSLDMDWFFRGDRHQLAFFSLKKRLGGEWAKSEGQILLVRPSWAGCHGRILDHHKNH